MRVILLVLFFYGCLIRTNSQDQIRYPEDASVYIGGFFNVYAPGPNGCSSTVDPYSIQEFEAVRWIIDKLNNNTFLPGGHKIGIHAFKTCGISERAVSSAIQLSQTYNNDNQSAVLFSILGPTFSSETKDMSHLFSFLPEADRLLMLSYGATSSKLADQSVYKNLYRVVPPDSVQVQVMLQLMLELKWNYVGIIYEDNDYGNDAAQQLRVLATAKGICIPVYHSFNSINSQESFKTFLKDVLDLKLGGIIYIGDDGLVKSLLELSTSISHDTEIIMSESNRLSSYYLKRIANEYFSIARGMLVTSVPKIDINEFDEYWRNIYTMNFSHTWVNVIPNIAQEIPQQSVYMNYAVKGILILANLFKKLQQKTCTNVNDIICSQLRQLPKQTYIDELGQSRTNLTEAFPFTDHMFLNTVSQDITFGENREIIYGPEYQTYEIYNFQQCNGLNDCEFLKVGNYKDDILQINKSVIQSYPLGENQGPYNQQPTAQCPNGTDCIKCIPSDISDHVIFVEGDWYVVAVVPVFVPDETNTLLCTNTIRDSLGTDIAESIKFAIEEINHPNNTLISSKKKVGLIVINGCASELVIKDKMLRLHKGTYQLRPGMKSSDINHRILGYVGGMSGSMSAAIAEVLAKLGYVQVSYASTSPLLSDRTLYPYFLRIPTADDQQAKVVIDIVTSLGSNIIQVIYTEGAYGEGAYSTLEKLGENAGICVIGHKVPVATDYTLYNGLLAKLRETPQAKLVVTFVRSHVIEQVVKAVTERMAETEFIFIGSETWGSRESVIPEQQRKVYGSLSIALELPPIPAFISYLTKQIINDPSDPWLRHFLENMGKCIFTGSFQRAGKDEVIGKARECDLESLVMSLYDQWIPFAVASTKALVKGLENVLSSTECGQPATSCPEQNPTLLAEYIKKNVKLDLYGKGSQERVFDDNGDGVVKYKIMHVTSGEKLYKQVGSWSKSQGIIFNKDSLYYPVKDYNSVCLTDYTCNKCFPDKMEEESPKQSTDGMIPAIVVLAVLTCLLGISVVILAIHCHRSRRDRLLQEPHYAEPENIKEFNNRNDKGITI
ncbi:metabotropic glutamate receptor 3-like [Patella vulgata]|uniref:metabotropic glutamate receptor 3-like n=1 Tax=Patella vulgata TaxID=6465 RepID=UPI0024A7DFD9|nr:metabotropic glutamate receptor 3-like [Patella vulgata]